jgi:hypothetical protein
VQLPRFQPCRRRSRIATQPPISTYLRERNDGTNPSTERHAASALHCRSIHIIRFSANSEQPEMIFGRDRQHKAFHFKVSPFVSPPHSSSLKPDAHLEISYGLISCPASSLSPLSLQVLHPAQRCFTHNLSANFQKCANLPSASARCELAICGFICA